MFGQKAHVYIQSLYFNNLLISFTKCHSVFHGSGSSSRCDPGYSIVLFLLCAVVVTSVIVLAVLIYTIKGNKCDYCNKGNRSFPTTSPIIELMLFCDCVLICESFLNILKLKLSTDREEITILEIEPKTSGVNCTVRQLYLAVISSDMLPSIYLEWPLTSG